MSSIQTSLMRDLTAIPVPGVTKVLHRERRVKSKEQLLRLVTGCNEQFPTDLSDLLKKVNELDVDRAWSPGFYLAQTHLLNAINDGYVVPIIDALHWLNEYKVEDIYDSQLRVDSILTESWEPTFVQHMRNYEPKDIHGRSTIVVPIIGSEITPHVDAIKEAISVIEKIDPVIYEEHEELVTRIKLFDGRVLRGESANSVFGAILFRIPPQDEEPVSYWVEHIVHEISHLKLETMRYDELFLNESHERFKAPIRRDPRPMLGIIHATFVLSRMVRVFRRLVAEGYPPAYAHRLEYLTKQFNSGIETIREHAKLTELGKKLVETFEPCAAGENA